MASVAPGRRCSAGREQDVADLDRAMGRLLAHQRGIAGRLARRAVHHRPEHRVGGGRLPAELGGEAGLVGVGPVEQVVPHRVGAVDGPATALAAWRAASSGSSRTKRPSSTSRSGRRAGEASTWGPTGRASVMACVLLGCGAPGGRRRGRAHPGGALRRASGPARWGRRARSPSRIRPRPRRVLPDMSERVTTRSPLSRCLMRERARPGRMHAAAPPPTSLSDGQGAPAKRRRRHDEIDGLEVVGDRAGDAERPVPVGVVRQLRGRARRGRR